VGKFFWLRQQHSYDVIVNIMSAVVVNWPASSCWLSHSLSVTGWLDMLITGWPIIHHYQTAWPAGTGQSWSSGQQTRWSIRWPLHTGGKCHHYVRLMTPPWPSVLENCPGSLGKLGRNQMREEQEKTRGTAYEEDKLGKGIGMKLT